MALEVYFVTGTGTDVGKTYIASRLAETRRAAGQRVGVYKPVASGCGLGDDGEPIAEDARCLWEAAGCPGLLHAVCPQRFAMSVAPPQAAAAVSTRVDEALLLAGAELWINSSIDVLIVEGAGGLFSPISDSMLNIDFALRLRKRVPQLTVVLVAPNRLGVIHDCVACVRASEHAGLTIDRIVLNQMSCEDDSVSGNAKLIEQWTGITHCTLDTLAPATSSDHLPSE